MKNILLATTISVTIAFTVNAQSWQPVGTAGFTPAGVDHPSLAINNNDEPYVAFKDGASAQKATVMKYDGANWVTVGTAGFSSHFAYNPTIAINSNNVPYVVYRDDVNSSQNKLTVKKFDGTDWVTVGIAEFSGNVQSDNISIAFNNNDEPYVAYTCTDIIDFTVNKASVMKFDGTNWVNVGAAGFTPSSARYISIEFNSNNEPHVIYRDGANSPWKATVMKFDGTNWVAVGTAGFSESGSDYLSLAFNDSNEPYVAYRDDEYSDKATVMKFDGTDWITVGAAGFSAGVASYTSLGFNSSNQPYVAFREFVSGSILNQATVMKFDGTNWITVGSAGFSAGYADQTFLAINSNDEPYVSFVDVTQLYKATVMKFGNGTTNIEDNIALSKSITIYPNPTKSVIHFSAKTNVQLTNAVGQVLTNKIHVKTLNLSDQPPGIYFITISDNNGQVLQRSKVMKE